MSMSNPRPEWGIGIELAQLRARGLWRTPRALQPLDSVTVRDASGRRLLVFCSNDYLGLARHPAVAQACRAGIDADGGTGSGAAHLVTGHRPVHSALEQALADWLERDRALLFSTGYMANLGVISAFAGQGDHILQDRLNHASLLDAGLLSGARMRRYRHNDCTHLQQRLQVAARRKLVVTDGVFSMDGDVAPLRTLLETADGAGAALMVDDAHGLGVLGSEGRGSVHEAGMTQRQVPLLVGTLGKSMGTFGAFVAGPDDWIELIQQKARTYIYTTAPPPAIAAATLRSLELVRTEPWRRTHLHTLIQRFRRGAEQLGLAVLPSRTPIQPLIVGDADAAVQAGKRLEEHGILVTAIRPPTVPPGSARLRITFSAAHSEDHVDRLLEALASVGPSVRAA